METNRSPYFIGEEASHSPSHPVDPEQARLLKWGTRKYDLHPQTIFLLMAVEFMFGVFSTIPGENIIAPIMATLILLKLPWVATSALLWSLFTKKNFQAGTRIKDVIIAREHIRQERWQSSNN